MGLAGTEPTIEKGATKITQKLGKNSQLKQGGNSGSRHWMSTDKVHGVFWKEQDPQAREGVREPEYDVTGLLQDGTLTIKGVIRIALPELDIEI
eukprot:136802-Rhodomonas_salina.1